MWGAGDAHIWRSMCVLAGDVMLSTLVRTTGLGGGGGGGTG